MPRRTRSSRPADADNSSDLSSLPEEASRGSWLPWQGESTAPSQPAVDGTAWLDQDDPSGTEFQPPPAIQSQWELRLLRSLGPALVRSAVGGAAVGGLVAALRQLNPDQSLPLLGEAGAFSLGLLAFVVLFVAHASLALGSNRSSGSFGQRS